MEVHHDELQAVQLPSRQVNLFLRRLHVGVQLQEVLVRVDVFTLFEPERKRSQFKKFTSHLISAMDSTNPPENHILSKFF